MKVSKGSTVSQVNLCRGILVLLTLIALIIWWLAGRSEIKPKVIVYEDVHSSEDLHRTNEMIHVEPLKDFKINNINTEQMGKVSIIYVIPGGGSSNDDGYPEWTKRRVNAAYDHYMTHNNRDKSLFLALSAGSLNSPNLLQNDGRIMFECQHMIQHLVNKGIPGNIIFGDTFSWDSVTNAHSLRMFLEGVLVYRNLNIEDILDAPVTTIATDGSSSTTTTDVLTSAQLITSSKPLVTVEVFISDFHAERIKESFLFLLGLQPSILPKIQLNINTVDSIGIKWKSKDDFQQRVRHEETALSRLKETKKQITTMSEYFAFIMLGGHQGLFKYVHNDYTKSKEVGW